MSNIEFTTHMLKSFTDKYGDLFASFFVDESIYGKYLGARDLYHSHELANVLTKESQSNFTRDFDKFVKLGKEKNCEMDKVKNELKDFFRSNRLPILPERDGDKTYWETLFAYSCYKSRSIFLDYQKVNINKYSTAMNSIISDSMWYKESLMMSVVWSIEFFRLRLFIEDLLDETFNFIHVLDWFDIFEFRILPIAMQRVISNYCDDVSENDALSAKDIISILKKKSDYPFSERLGVKEQSDRKALWNIRKNMLPIVNSTSDVNLDEDIGIFNDIAQLIRKRAGTDSSVIEAKGKILAYTSERNRIRQNYKKPNGTSYTKTMILGMDLSVIDIECMNIFISEFKELTVNIDSLDIQSIISAVGIHHLLYHEILEEEKEDFSHNKLLTLKNDLEYTYRSLKKNVLESIVQKYSEDKSLHMEISLSDEYKDELLTDMLMIGSQYLTNNSSDSLFRKIYEHEIKQDDYERNCFINQTWSSMEPDDRMICALHVNDIGLLERINCVDEKYLSLDELKYVEKLEKCWISALNKINTELNY